ncbi:MAG: hypothetical protein LAQ30_24445 [Acidobacteriia bacterium]|nr:hypothetical protein [Terriglobia bacterium]
MRDTLFAALVRCADNSLQPKARRFLAGLSCDELQFIAEFLGACILEPAQNNSSSRTQLAQCVAEFQRFRGWCCARSDADRDHKMILLLEYLCCSGVRGLRLCSPGAGYAAAS